MSWSSAGIYARSDTGVLGGTWNSVGWCGVVGSWWGLFVVAGVPVYVSGVAVMG